MDQKEFAAMGGRARADSLTSEERSEISRAGINKRWKEYYKAHPEKLAARKLKDSRKGKRGRPKKLTRLPESRGAETKPKAPKCQP